MLIDGDLASNNGGWQWSAGTGTDPQPYFRIFNPYNQSEKVGLYYRGGIFCWRPFQADPTGNYIREFVPELGGLRGAGEDIRQYLGVGAYLYALLDLHKPSPKTAQKLGYALPLIDHGKARDRALRRYKNPGTEWIQRLPGTIYVNHGVPE
jgi:deoxyribodipyrimidine photo-lyase